MEPKSVIIGKRRDNGRLELVSDLNHSIRTVEEAFMPFRMSRENAVYEWTMLGVVHEERVERHDAPRAGSATFQKKDKSK